MTAQQRSIVDRIEHVIRTHPDNDAIDTSVGTMSYRELGLQVQEFAQQLTQRTAPGEFVGIEASRNSGAIVAMIGALQARRPFIVLDPRDSAASNADKVALLGIRVVAQGKHAANGAELANTPTPWRRGGPVEPTEISSVEGDIGYAIHTSGSTGEPKCVLVRTAPLTTVIDDHVARLAVAPWSRTLQFARLTFDGCLTEILWTLTAGACLVVLDETHLAPGSVLQNTLEQFRITHLKTTPFALTATEPSSAMTLERVLNGGGACRPAVVRKWSTVARVHNAYGLTETTVCNFLSGALTADDCARSVPLGELVGDCDYYIHHCPSINDHTSDSADRGELVLTGASVGIGYLTAHGVEPFTNAAGLRLYHTGDLVELDEGRLYFVERLDRQVKVRGYRLDPGEIENTVCQLDSVLDAVVTAESHEESDGADPDALVCYYQGGLEARDVRKHLDTILDPYKIPSVLKRIATFPYTPNGKVDRDALRATRHPTPQSLKPTSPDAHILHFTRTLTGIDDAALHDNFFDLGGDSASAVVLVNKLKELGWLDAGVRDVLRADDLQVLANQLRERSV